MGLVDVSKRTVARQAVAVVAEHVADQDAAPVEESAGALTAC